MTENKEDKSWQGIVLKILTIVAAFTAIFLSLTLNFHIFTEKYAYDEVNYEKIQIADILEIGLNDFRGKLNLPENEELNSKSDKLTLEQSNKQTIEQEEKLSQLLSKQILNQISKQQYNELFLQTGLGKIAVNTVISQAIIEFMEQKENFNEVEFYDIHREVIKSLENYQKNFFKKPSYKCEKIGFITYEEHIRDSQGRDIKTFEIPDLKTGDVLITRNTHSLGWRHGHSGIVIDGQGRQSLEATVWGQNTTIQDVEKWKTYPSFILLRPKEGIDGNRVATYAIKTMNDLSYGLLTGIPEKAPNKIKKTQCAHLIWYPYFKEGVDVDNDGGWLVTPKDITNLKHFDIIQVYGVNPLKLWP